jgi:peroxiredoxin Q/BCP
MKLNIGEKAPDFTATIQDGSQIKLSDFKGKKVILYFYPNDDTPTCTLESCNLRDNYPDLTGKGYEVLGISANDEKSHQKFINKYDLPFNLIADTDKSIHDAYGTWVEKNMYGRKYMGTARTTFVIDADGVIENIITKVKAKEHTAQILES